MSFDAPPQFNAVWGPLDRRMYHEPTRFKPMSLLPPTSKSMSGTAPPPTPSTAPMSQRAVPSLLPSTWRGKPRWSVSKSAPELSRQPPGLPASMAGLPATRVCVWVGPPLFFRERRICATETRGTTSVGPGEKPVTPALPSEPNRLKLLALTTRKDHDVGIGRAFE